MRPRRSARPAPALVLAGLAALAGGCSASVSRELPLSTASLPPPRPPLGMMRDAPPYDQRESFDRTRGGAPYSGAPPSRWSEAPRPTGPIEPVPPVESPAPHRYHAYYGSGRGYGYMPTGAVPSQGTVIEVREGDTLYGLSRRHGVPVADLVAANRLESGHIEIGQRLIVPAPR